MTETSAAPLFEQSTSYRVHLDAFEGPLDLLLHLIKKNEVNICDIPISDITRQYLQYLQLMKELNLEIAGDFLVMASTLLQIKSRELLPAPYEEEEGEEEDDPRAELIRRLLEYRKYKEAGLALEEREVLGRDVFARTFASPELAEFPAEEEGIPDVELFLLVDAFREVLARAPKELAHEVYSEGVSVAERMTQVLESLLERETVVFQDLFPVEAGREFLVATFLAILELCRMRMLRILQATEHGPIWVIRSVRETGEEESDV